MVADISRDRTVYVALMVTDEEGNDSGLSNIAVVRFEADQVDTVLEVMMMEKQNIHFYRKTFSLQLHL